MTDDAFEDGSRAEDYPEPYVLEFDPISLEDWDYYDRLMLGAKSS